MCYIIIKIYDLFNYYIQTLIYILKDKQQLIRYDNIYISLILIKHKKEIILFFKNIMVL